MRYAIVSIEAHSPRSVAAAIAPAYRVVAQLNDLAVLIEGTGDLPVLDARMVEIGADVAALLMHRP